MEINSELFSQDLDEVGFEPTSSNYDNTEQSNNNEYGYNE